MLLIGLEADIESLEALIGELAASIEVDGVVMLDDDDIDGLVADGLVVEGLEVVSVLAVLLQPLSARAVAATARAIGHVILFVMSISKVGHLASILRARPRAFT